VCTCAGRILLHTPYVAHAEASSPSATASRGQTVRSGRPRPPAPRARGGGGPARWPPRLVGSLDSYKCQISLNRLWFWQKSAGANGGTSRRANVPANERSNVAFFTFFRSSSRPPAHTARPYAITRLGLTRSRRTVVRSSRLTPVTAAPFERFTLCFAHVRDAHRAGGRAPRGGGPNHESARCRGLTIRAGIKSDLGTGAARGRRCGVVGRPCSPPGRRAPRRPAAAGSDGVRQFAPSPDNGFRLFLVIVFENFSGLEFGTFIHLFPPHLSGSHHLVSLHPRCTPRRATVSRAPSRLDSSRPDGTRGRSAFRSRHCTAHLCRRPRSV
jgi:hypothetical protein